MEESSGLTCKVLALITVVSVIAGWLLSRAAGIVYRLSKKIYEMSTKALAGRVTSEKLFQGKRLSGKKWFFIDALFLIAAWFPVFLAYYPGIFAYDVLAQMYQRLYGYSTHHPLIHTLLLGWFYDMGGKLGNVNYGIALYSLFQMLVLALAVSYMMYFLRRQKMPAVFRAAVLVFMGLMPVVSMLSISATKDTLFSAFFLVAFTLLCEFCLEPESIRVPWKAVLFTACAVLACLFRNQGKYVLCVTLLLWLVLMPEKTRKRGVVIIALTACIYLASDAALVTATDASAGSANEYQNIPVVSKVFHLSLYIWLPVVIAAAFVGKAGIRKQAAPVVMLAAFVGTLLLGPCALPRYILPVMLCIPAFYAFMKRSAGKGRAAG